ncbi:hypothetical protein, partial [Enorma sp.]|uniref:hypothetical protein n=1 Tax=Enorma sp. TaxID=1920692 RepID=UPI003AB1E05A
MDKLVTRDEAARTPELATPLRHKLNSSRRTPMFSPEDRLRPLLRLSYRDLEGFGGKSGQKRKVGVRQILGPR